MIRSSLLGLLLLPALSSAADPAAPSAPYQIHITAKGHYDTSGMLETVEFVDAKSNPAGFLKAIEAQLRKRPIEPKLADGVPATFDTAIYVVMTITPKAGGADAHIDSIGQGPFLIRRAALPYPRELAQTENWEGRLVGECAITVEGRCGRVQIIEESPGMPDVGRRYVRDSMMKWKFEPQRIAGKPIESTYQSTFNLRTGDAPPPEYFGGTRL